MNIGLCAWSFTGAHKEANRAIDPHTPEGLTRFNPPATTASTEYRSNLRPNGWAIPMLAP